jgi:hypothetical protein
MMLMHWIVPNEKSTENTRIAANPISFVRYRDSCILRLDSFASTQVAISDITGHPFI